MLGLGVLFSYGIYIPSPDCDMRSFNRMLLPVLFIILVDLFLMSHVDDGPGFLVYPDSQLF